MIGKNAAQLLLKGAIFRACLDGAHHTSAVDLDVDIRIDIHHIGFESNTSSLTGQP